MRKSVDPAPVDHIRKHRAKRDPTHGNDFVFPYAGGDTCKRCGKRLSKLNPHVICFSCIDYYQRKAGLGGDTDRFTLLNRRRYRNPLCPSNEKIDAAFVLRTFNVLSRFGPCR